MRAVFARKFLMGLQTLLFLLCAANVAANPEDVPDGQPKKIIRPLHIKPPTSAKVSPQIIGGSQATAGMFPWHAWLDITQIGTTSGYLCGASLISTKYAMSACHCIMSITKFKHEIVLGTISRFPPTAGNVRKAIAAPICHESYVDSTTTNDVSLLPFDSPVTLTANIQLINLPQPSLASTNLVGTRANVSGFGRISDSTQTTSNTLKYATLTITTDASCSSEYGSQYSASVMMCAKAPAADQADCNGDSGGALVYNNGTAWVQIGIVSWGGTSCQTTSSVYTRVTSFVDWVNNKMSALDSGTTTSSVATTTSTKTTAPTTTRTTTTRTTTIRTTTIRPTTTTRTTTTRTTRTTTTRTTTIRTTTIRPSTTTKTTTTRRPQCASQDFKKLLTSCCSPTAKDLLAKSYNSAVETTCKKAGGDNTAFNLLVINKLQDYFKNNTIDLTNTANLLKQLGKAACYIQCYLNQTGIIVDSNGDIDVTALTELLIANQEPNGFWANFTADAVNNCTELVTGLSLPSLTYQKLTCDPSGALIVQCVLASIIDQCPSKATACAKDYAVFDQCKAFVYSALMNSSLKKIKKP